MRWLRPTLLLVTAFALAGGCGFLPSEPVGLEVGQRAPDIDGTDSDGKSLRLSSYQGKVVLLDFWAGWCGPCMMLVPHNKELVAKYRGEPFVLLGINRDNSREAQRKVELQNDLPWRSWHDGRGDISDAWKVQALPTLYVLDRKGVIRYSSVGVPPEGEVEKVIDELLKEEE